ncbi:MAG: DJ-1/PfpI family protein [Petrotogales bacterium]
MKKVMFFIYNEMVDYEFSLAADLIGFSEEFEVFMVSYEKSPVKSKSGIVYQPTYGLDEILEIDNIDGIVITGGWKRKKDERLTAFLEKLNKEEKLIAAICAGPEFLTDTNILKSHNYTSSLPHEEYVNNNEEDPFPREKFIDEFVVRDRNLITAKGEAFIDFAIEIADWLGVFENFDKKEEMREIFKLQ